MTHIFYQNSLRALCWLMTRASDEPLDDQGEICEDCQRMADIVLRTHARMPASKK